MNSFLEEWKRMFFKTLVAAAAICVFLAGIFLPGYAMDSGLVTTVPGKAAMTLIMMMTLIAGLSIVFAWDKIEYGKPPEQNYY